MSENKSVVIESKSEKPKNKFISFLSKYGAWIVGVISICAGLSYLQYSLFGAILIILSGILALPIVYNKIKVFYKEKHNFNFSKLISSVFIILLLFVGNALVVSTTGYKDNQDKLTKESNVKMALNKESQSIESVKKAEEKSKSDEAKKEADKKKEGAVLAGIGREELEKTYNETNSKQSKFKADEYLKSLKGQTISWVAKVDNVDTDLLGVPYINMKMGIYTVRVYDSAKTYTDLNKGIVVKVDGTIKDINNVIGVAVYIDPTSITPIQ